MQYNILEDVSLTKMCYNRQEANQHYVSLEDVSLTKMCYNIPVI